MTRAHLVRGKPHPVLPHPLFEDALAVFFEELREPREASPGHASSHLSSAVTLT
jgi:hypothetical protein